METLEVIAPFILNRRDGVTQHIPVGPLVTDSDTASQIRTDYAQYLPVPEPEEPATPQG